MRIKWDNFGKGLEAIADAKMSSDAGELLNRQQQTTLSEKGGLQNNPNFTYDSDTGQYVPSLQAINESQAAGVDTTKEGWTDRYSNANTAGEYDAERGLRPQFKSRSSFAGQEYDTPLSPQEVRKQNRQAAIDYWTTKGTFGKEGLKTLSDEESAESARTTAGLQQKHLTNTITKEEGQTAADKEVSTLLDRANLHAPDSPEHQQFLSQAAQKVTAAYGAVKGQEYLANQFKLSETRREADVKKREDAWWQAAKSEDSAVDRYNKEYKDGSTAKVVESKEGRQIVRFDSEGNKIGVIGKPYKSWDEGGRQMVLNNIDSIAKEDYKLGKQHEYKLAEIRETGKEHVKYARALADGRDKSVKLTPQQKENFAVIDKELQDAGDDVKKLEVAQKKMHNFSNAVLIAAGREARVWAAASKEPRAAKTWTVENEKHLQELPEYQAATSQADKDILRARFAGSGGTGISGGFVIPGAGGRTTQKPPPPQNKEAVRVPAGDKYTVRDPVRGLMGTADYTRIYGKEWTDLPIGK